MINDRLKLQYGKGPWRSGYVKPAGKFWKRLSSKRVRKTRGISNGMLYKKAFGWFDLC